MGAPETEDFRLCGRRLSPLLAAEMPGMSTFTTLIVALAMAYVSDVAA